MIEEINTEGVTVLLVEQNARQALGLAHQAYVLETGEVIRCGPGAELIARPLINSTTRTSRSSQLVGVSGVPVVWAEWAAGCSPFVTHDHQHTTYVGGPLDLRDVPLVRGPTPAECSPGRGR